jgi:hypothetical protein
VYQAAPYGATQHRPPARGELDLYVQPPYPGDPDRFGDQFAGGGHGTGAFPAVTTAPSQADGEREDLDARLLYSPPGPPHRVRSHRAQLTSAALAAVALLVGAISAWAAFGGHPGAGPGAQLAGRQTTATRGTGRTSGEHATQPPSPARPAPTPSAPAPSPVAATPSLPGGAAVVTMAPGLSQAPDAAQVDGFLVSYFTAINDHDYQQYARLLIPARRAQLSAAAFAHGYGTTTDSGASIVGISATGSGVAATVTFTSQQWAADAGVTSCTIWNITLYLQKQGPTLLIGTPPTAYHAYHRTCP